MACIVDEDVDGADLRLAVIDGVSVTFLDW